MPLSPDDQPTAGPAPWPAPTGYDLLAEQGRGGMGVVYRARQQATGRLVALKFVRDGGLARPEERARFRIEAEAAARMRHEHIVLIVAVGEQGGAGPGRRACRRSRWARRCGGRLRVP
jgi:serine/threonine protein kinase